MICSVCELEYDDTSMNIGTCPDCLAVIIINSVEDESPEREETEDE